MSELCFCSCHRSHSEIQWCGICHHYDNHGEFPGDSADGWIKVTPDYIGKVKVFEGESIMRRVVCSVWDRSEKYEDDKGVKRERSIYVKKEGWFHEWTKIHEDGQTNTYALIELEDGTMIEIELSGVRFIDPPV